MAMKSQNLCQLTTSCLVYCILQVISLGAGFDSAFFRLQASGHLQKVTFIEVDFPQVAERKTALIEANCELKNCLGDDWKQTERSDRASSELAAGWLENYR